MNLSQNPRLDHSPRTLNGRQADVLRAIEPFVAANLSTYLKPVQDSWQPSDYLPDLSRQGWRERLDETLEAARELPDALLVALVGNMITEEALPSYESWLNGLAGLADATGTDSHGWARWTRGWTAEENRHGDLLNRYLYLTGRVDMRAVEVTVHYLTRNGFNPETENDAYQGFVYTSFQERATKISHRNAAILASQSGEKRLQEICGIIAGDEARHERAYQAFMKKIFELDAEGALLAFAKMMKKKIVMPARTMEDGQSTDLFNQYSAVAQRVGIYTARDYIEITEHLLRIWDVAHLPGMTGAAAEAQDFVCGLPKRYARLAERKTVSQPPVSFTWIHGRKA